MFPYSGSGVYFHLGWTNLLGAAGVGPWGFPWEVVGSRSCSVCVAPLQEPDQSSPEKQQKKKRNLNVKMLEMILMTSSFFPL